ncbi:E2/UBC family protein [Patulibacter defluvii]|uniref:E2/UBC family protein n=1 Tax=Patulibacter defluvii TaxID=3095358 RepID=UPI002A75E91E|nr:E2/UBC family protein [Patulibacter sp. DM4]
MSDLLPDSEVAFLRESSLAYETHLENQMIVLVIKDYPLPQGYAPATTDLLLRLHPQFPEIGPDMFWMLPFVSYADGGQPPATEQREPIVQRDWQRWSRHFTTSPWRPGVDNLRSFLTLIRAVLTREVAARAA